MDKTVFSPADLEYVSSHSSLRVDEAPKKLPWVKVSALLKSWGRNDAYVPGAKLEQRKRSMTFEVVNMEPRPVDVELIWFFVGERVKGKIGSSRMTKSENFYTFNQRSSEVSLGPKENFEFRTENARTTEVHSSSGHKSGSKVAGFCIQAYWNGYLVGHYASDPSCRDLSEDGTLYTKFKGGRR